MMHITADMARRGAEVVAKMHREVQAMRGLFRVHVAGQVFEMPVESYDWQDVAGVPGVQMCALPVADWPPDPVPNADYFLTRSTLPVAQSDLVIQQAIVNEILEGELEFWKESSPTCVRLVAGDAFRLLPCERHGWRATSPFLCRISFSPKFLQT